MKRSCPNCSKIYQVFPSEIARGKRLTCSRECRRELNREEMPRPNCPHCGSRDVTVGKVKGENRYRCTDCRKTFFDRPPVKKCKGDKPLSNAERQAIYRKKKSLGTP